MSNYTQTTFFAPKDSLVSGNPAKLIRGADVDPELAAIAVAIATKYDSTNISGGQVPFGAGTAAAPSITFAAALNTGIYLSAANTVGITANGSFEAAFKGGQVLGAPTGGAKGIGTLNATGLYINGTALGTVTGFATPSGLATLVAAAGAATTAIRSDANIAIDVTISPTWSGTHTFSGAGIVTTFAGKIVVGAPSSGTALTINGVSLGNFATLTDGTRTIGIGANGASAVQFGTTTNHELDIFTNNVTRVAIGNAGNITINTPTSGGHIINVADASGVFISTANTSPYLRFGNSTDSNGFIVYTGTTMNLQTANATRIGISAAAGVVVSAPTSGPALTVNGLAASTAIQVSTVSHSGNIDIDGANIIVGTNAAASGQSGLIRFRKDTGANAWYAGVLQTGAAVNFSIYDAVNAREALNIAPGGNITIDAPSSGTPLAITGISLGTFFSFSDGTRTGNFATNGASAVQFGTSSAHDLDLYTSGSTRLVIGASGNLTVVAPTSGVALSVNAVSGQYAQVIQGAGTAGNNLGLKINAGAGATDAALLVQNSAASLIFTEIFGDGHGTLGPSSTTGLSWNTSGALTINASSGTPLFVQANGTNIFEALGTTAPTIQGYGPVAAALTDLTPDTSTFTFTATGMTTSPTGTATWSRIGKLVSLFVPAITGTSNAVTFTMTGMPTAIQPATLTQLLAVPNYAAEDNSVTTNTVSCKVTAGSGTLTFLITSSTNNWTSSGAKGVVTGFTINYLLN